MVIPRGRFLYFTLTLMIDSCNILSQVVDWFIFLQNAQQMAKEFTKAVQDAEQNYQVGSISIWLGLCVISKLFHS